MKFGSRIKKVLSLVCSLLGTVFLSLSIAGKWYLVPSYIQDEIEANVQLKNGTETWNNFIAPSVPIYMMFKIFHVVNAEDVKRHGSKPELKEVGPYVYREIREKKNVAQYGRDTISYTDYKAYIYDQEGTDREGCVSASSQASSEVRNCDKNDEVTVIHPIVALLGAYWDLIPWDSLGSLPFDPKEYVVKLLNEVFLGEGKEKDDIFLKTTVNDLLYEGSYIPLIANGIKFLEQFSDLLPVEDVIASLPAQISSDGYFAFFKGENGSMEATNYRIDNGVNGLDRILQIVAFNGKSSLPSSWWSSASTSPEGDNTTTAVKNTCFDLKGTDGSQFAPQVDDDQELWIFNSQLCRSIWLSYDGPAETRGISAKRFRPPPEVFSMGTPDNFCFCPEFESCRSLSGDGTQWNMTTCREEYNCKNGLLKMTGCYGVPIFISSPHFYNGDARLLLPFEGLRPVQDSHDTVLDIEPMTGVPISAHKRIQLSVPTKAVKDLGIYQGLVGDWSSEIVFPLLWADEGTDIDEENAQLLKDALTTPLQVLDIVLIIGMSLGLLLLVLSWLLTCKIVS